MDKFTRYNRKSIDDRKIDTLIGLSKGILADGIVNQKEAEFLLNWLIQSRQASDHPVILNLLDKVEVMLSDRLLDAEEAQELLELLHRISGEPAELGELMKTAHLPVDDPVPTIIFKNKTFLFTGTCAFGTRKQCMEATETLGGMNETSVTKRLNYLVIGTYVTDSWRHETFGRKIEMAMNYRLQGHPLAIVTEEHWADCGGLVI